MKLGQLIDKVIDNIFRKDFAEFGELCHKSMHYFLLTYRKKPKTNHDEFGFLLW